MAERNKELKRRAKIYKDRGAINAMLQQERVKQRQTQEDRTFAARSNRTPKWQKEQRKNARGENREQEEQRKEREKKQKTRGGKVR